jgi:hypothetical protein
MVASTDFTGWTADALVETLSDAICSVLNPAETGTVLNNLIHRFPELYIPFLERHWPLCFDADKDVPHRPLLPVSVAASLATRIV